MAKTQEATRRESFTSPTFAAPVLVGLDGSAGGRDALELGRVLASIRGARPIVAVPEFEPMSSEARAVLGDPQVKIDPIGILAPARMLLECARRENAGTLVVGSTRRGKVGRALLGSVGGQVLHRAPCEVLVAPRGYASERHQGFAKIAVAVDGTPGSKVALTRAEDLARQAGASLEILVAADPLVAGVEAEFPAAAPTSLSSVLEAAIGAVDPALATTARWVDSGAREIARTIANALAEACDPEVDLLLAGSRRPLDRFLMGSVTRHLIAHAPCPVLVIPHAE